MKVDLTYEKKESKENKTPINKYEWERLAGKRRKAHKSRRTGKHAAQHGQKGCFGK